MRGPWPTISERLVLATVAWLPFALLIGYGGGALTGCDRSAASCPDLAQPVQAVLIAAVLGAMALAPKLAYLASAGTVGFLVSAAAAAFVAALVRPPDPLGVPLAALVLVLLATVYVLTAVWASRDGPVRRPWLAPGRAGAQR